MYCSMFNCAITHMCNVVATTLASKLRGHGSYLSRTLIEKAAFTLMSVNVWCDFLVFSDKDVTTVCKSYSNFDSW